MVTIATVKIGDTFSFVATITDLQNSPMPGIVAQLKSQVRDKNDALMSELAIEEVDVGQYSFRTDQTSLWQVGELYCDIQYTNLDDDVITSSNTMLVKVVKDVTR